MTEKNTRSPEPSVREPAVNRRRLLKAAVATAPVIATLSSGAALARSSNLIGATSGSGTDGAGNTLCLQLPSEPGRYRDGLVDLGPHAQGTVNLIPPADYREGLDLASAPISEREMCESGGVFYATGSINVPQGIVASAMAVSSFLGALTINPLREII